MSELKDLPTGWEIVSLSVLADINPKLPFEFVQPDIDVSFLPMKLIEEENNQIHLTEYRKYEDVKKGFTPMVDGDVIFAKITPCMENGKIAVVHSLKNGIAFGSTEFHVLRCNTVVFNTFLFYFLVQKNTRQEAQQYMTGAVGQRRVPKSYLESLQIPLPPLAEQHRIVAKIEELFTALDKGVESLKTAREQLKIYRQAVLKWAFEGKFTSDVSTGSMPEETNEATLPEGWKWARIDQIATIGTGATPLKNNKLFYENGTIPWITSGALNEQFVKSASDYVTELAVKENNLTIYPPHTLLLAMYGEGKTRGKCSELLIAACTNQAIAAISFENHNYQIKPYLKYFLLKNYIDIRKLASGGVQPNLNLGIVKSTTFPLPPTLTEQEHIISEIERRLSVCDTIEASIEASLQKADALRQSILKKAFEGKLVPQDPADEPASVLLERVRVERAAAKGEEGGKKRKEY